MARCPICGINKSNKKDLLEHVENKHKDEIPQDMSTAQYVYSLNHDGRSYGICRICGDPTPWNEKTGKPKQICGKKSCKDKVSREFEANLKSKLNMTRQDLMNDPDHQEQMLANRKISGIYKWSDGIHKFTYTGTYEKFALEWLDKILDIDPEGLQTPGPKIQYMFNGKPHYWITDMYLTDYNLVIEVKDGGTTGDKNTHPGFAHNRDLEKAKDDYMKTQNEYNYIKLTNKNMMQLIKTLSEIRLQNIFNEEKGLKKNDPIININESVETFLTTNPFEKEIILYHGSHNPNRLNVIKPLSRNAGTRLSKPRYSSFWANRDFAIEFAVFKLIHDNGFMIYYSNDNRWLIQRSKKQDIINSLKNKYIWLYSKKFKKSEVDRGHEQSDRLDEFSVDIDVIPDKTECLKFNDFKDIVLNKLYPILPDDKAKAKELALNSSLTFKGKSNSIIKNLIYHDLDTTINIIKNMDKENPNINESVEEFNSLNETVSDKFFTDNTYFISDTHIYKHIPEIYADTIIDNINKSVSKNDKLIFLGDIGHKEDPKLKEHTVEFISKIKIPNKYLILGNHDVLPIEEYYKMGFKGVYKSIKSPKYILTHLPYKVSGDLINIHGHIHLQGEYWGVDPENHINVYFKLNPSCAISLKDALDNLKKGKYNGTTRHDKPYDWEANIPDGENLVLDESFDYEDLLDLDPLMEVIALEKATAAPKSLYLNIASYVKDIIRKWQGIQEINVSSEEKKCIEKIISLSKKLCDHIGEILKTNNNISYETDYEMFLEEVAKYKKARKNKEKNETISISVIQNHTKYIDKKAQQYLKMNADSKFNKKYKNALYMVQSRTLYVLNTALYNASGKGSSGKFKSDKNAGIAQKRYGNSETRINIKNLDQSSSAKEILTKLRNSSSYNQYKKIFDDVLSQYNRTNVSALKMLDLEKHNKLVFLTYSSMKPMILKKGTKLYHISKCATIDALNPIYKCRDNITFYARPRVYFIDKLVNPKSVLPDADGANIYEYTCTKDTTAYRDNEYGSWFHHCIYLESETPLKVKNITDEVKDMFLSKKEKASKDSYISGGSKKDASNKIDKEIKKQNEWIDYIYDNELLLLNEDASDIFDSSDETAFSVILDITKTTVDDTLKNLENKLKEIVEKFKKLPVTDKKENIDKILNICKKALKILATASGVCLVKSGKDDLKSNKKFMRALKYEMPMNHETYNKINTQLTTVAILKIISGVLLVVINLVIINKLFGKHISKPIISMTNSLGKISKNSTDSAVKNQCKTIINNLMKLFNLGIIHENAELYDVVDVSDYVKEPITISNAEIDALCEGVTLIPETNEIDVLNEVSFPFFFSNKKIDKASDELYKHNKSSMPEKPFSTYDINKSSWKDILFPKNEFTKKVTSVFHKVEINKNNHTIEIRGINYRKLIQHIKDLYPDQKVYKIFEIIYNSKDWDKYANKRIPKSDVRVEYIQTYEFFALELSVLFKELYEKYNLSYYNDICVEIYNKTWLSNSDIIKPESIDLSRLRLLNQQYELKPYQKEFIESYPNLKARLNLNGYILSFDQGLGKTLTSIALAMCLNKDRVYIVCPNALKENWAIEIKQYFPKYENEELWKEDVFIHGVSKSFDSKKAKFIIVNQESIAKISDKIDSKTNNMLIVDESHNFRNLNSARSQELIKLRDALNTKDILVMSGTPIKASPNEICPVLRLIDPLFTDEVASIYNKCFNMNDIAASNLIQTRFGKVMYRKTKAEVLNLPEKHIDVLKVKVKDPNRYIVKNIRKLVKDRAKELYKTEYKEYDSMKEEFHDIIEKYSTSSKDDINKYLTIIDENIPNYELHEMDVLFKQSYLDKYVYPNITDKDKECLDYLLVRFVNMWQHCIGVALGEIMHPRRKELFMKLYDDNKVIINNMIFDNKKKTVIFTPIVEVANHIHKALGEAGLSSVLVTGQVKDKLTPILRFKEDSNIDVLVATSQTLGTGVTLTEANLMFFFGTPWRSADFDQCCDRIYRIGQTDDVFIFRVLMDSDELNLSTRMEDILNWSNTMFGAMITSTDDIENLNESVIISESVQKSKIDSDYKPKGKLSISDFKKVNMSDNLTKYNISKNKIEEFKKFSEYGSGYIWLDDDNNLIAQIFVNQGKKKKNDKGVISELNIDNKYKGYGLSKQILDIAVNELNANSLWVYKDNEIAVNLYKKYGFKVTYETNDQYFMELNSTNEAVMSIVNLSPIITNGLFEELQPNETNENLENELEELKKSLCEAVINEEAIYDQEHKYPIFIVLMHSGTNVADAIKKFTHDEYSHAAISFNPDCDPLYSFGRKKVLLKDGTGFCPTSPSDDFFKEFKSVYAVYVMYLTKEEYDKMRIRLQYFIDNIDSLKYDILGLGMAALKIPTDNHKKYFCSRFVADILSSGKELDKAPSLYRPNDFVYRTDITLVNKGIDFSKYDKNKTLKNLELVKKGLYDRISVQESISTSDFAFSNGEYSAICDNRFTDFQTGNPDEQNEDIDPDAGFFSPNNTKPAPDYMDASNNFETNEDVRVDIQFDPGINNPDDFSSINKSIYNSNFLS